MKTFWTILIIIVVLIFGWWYVSRKSSNLGADNALTSGDSFESSESSRPRGTVNPNLIEDLAKQALTIALLNPAANISTVSVDSAVWPDTCLGYGTPGFDSMCDKKEVPGYKVILSSGGQNYEVRVDTTGTMVRIPANAISR